MDNNDQISNLCLGALQLLADQPISVISNEPSEEQRNEHVLKKWENNVLRHWKILFSLFMQTCGDSVQGNAAFSILNFMTTNSLVGQLYQRLYDESNSLGFISSPLNETEHLSEENLKIESSITFTSEEIEKEKENIKSVLLPSVQSISSSLELYASKESDYRSSIEGVLADLKLARARWEIVRNVTQILLLESGISFLENKKLAYIMDLCGDREDNYSSY
ncbi:CENP-H ortholog Fta3 [Schizosaccharomyces pombe]|uniref:Inner kinetochore subunit fta3 n=1 Tax=Schizosaccharomyces pombe (strain 972 / ATCC 24843) TaxID=284812 RepID=CENPH_SCHPO|nr:CENP-H-like protein Fta3 [Schizosaccharomyces pombe]O94261.1 RecName: Full=Inner kinetochore subunit fta3; AltName: Full=CENP-H homolog; AltName: Full=Constitutive centromere-associated network protein fta3; AltName: Full=Sim4 complex subunit fta3; AltName: Full=Sim4-mal2-associated protein 3 [Schizosaccharomyces pombe 972h-]CAA21797.1 CENP-H homolog Fta3 [Schizosaccharomyces pombe]|eukprot:NP_001342770.1 CENP-H-like protein Fta3 [Schizosaccharomyces pombe]